MVPKFDELKSVVGKIEGVEPFKSILPWSLDCKPADASGYRENCLSGRCGSLSTTLETLLSRNFGIRVRWILAHGHNFLETDTLDVGTVILDPTLGQMVVFPHIFVGTRKNLREVFTDPANEFLAGRRLHEIDHDIISREEWLQILYTPIFVRPRP